MSELISKAFALRFISGKYQGGEYPLRRPGNILIGRANDLEMVLVEDMVSRQHAKITVSSDNLAIEDLGSTNGTFVNGEKISKINLREGDRILIGTNIIRVVKASHQSNTEEQSHSSPPAPSYVESYSYQPEQDGQISAEVDIPLPPTPPSPAPQLDQLSQPKRTQLPTSCKLEGSLADFPLTDILNLLSGSKNNGVLHVQHQGEVGRIILREGQVKGCSIDQSTNLGALRAIYRLLSWDEGTFELEVIKAEELHHTDELNIGTEGLLMEAMQQLDEINALSGHLPSRATLLSLARPLGKPLKDLTEEQLDTVELIHNFGIAGQVIDNIGETDLEAYSIIIDLIQARVIQTL